MSPARLSALDASFLEVETASAHMHVGWVAMFSPPAGGDLPGFREIRDHIQSRLARARRYRQKLAPVPFGLHAPEWVDDPDFTVDRHVYWAPGPCERLVDEVMSMGLRRDRPLWEIWVCEDAENERVALIGKMHHCMVDGVGAVELSTLLLDLTPQAPAGAPQDWSAQRVPGGPGLLLGAARDLAREQLELLRWPLRVAGSPARLGAELAGAVPRVARATAHSLSPAPESALNRPLSPSRRLAWVERPLEDLRRVKRAHKTTINDVLLAAVAGGVGELVRTMGDEPAALKAMVPVSVRSQEQALGNRLSFVFADLPCDEPDPVRRLRRVHATMTRRKRDGEPEGADLVFKLASRSPRVVQHAISRAFASPRTFNLVVSNIPGPSQRMFMRGCPLQAAYPVVPLASSHALSIGMTSVCDRMCLGIHADREAIPETGRLADDVDAAITELVATTVD